MQRNQILIDLDHEIARLQQARALLAGETVHTSATKRKPGRPPGSGKLSLESRKRIAAAMKRSWALRKKNKAD
jgi:hypothetical protein